MPITAGQIYQAVSNRHHPVDGPARIRIIDDPVTISGLYGSGKVLVETVRPDGTGTRKRRIELSQLHESATTQQGAPRRTGYVLVTPCSLAGPHLAHRAWTTPDVGVCPGIPAATGDPR